MGMNTAVSTSEMAIKRAGDLLHGLAGRVARREAFLVHDALDVFGHHDGVVHQDADGERPGRTASAR